jgi:regulatory protein
MTDTADRSARHWALKTLARRMHTAWEIERGLAERGWPSGTIGQVVGDLREQGYIDDTKFAQIWVASRSERRLYGSFRLLNDLLARGVEEQTAKNAIQRFLPREKEMAIARKAAEKKTRSMKISGVRAMASLHRHLRSRGFQSEVVRAVLSDFFPREDGS